MRLMNTAKLTALFALLVAVFGLLGYWFGGFSGLVLGLLFAAVMNLATYWYSDRIVLKMYRAQPLPEQTHGQIHDTVAALADAAGIPKPSLYLMRTETPNAFATGRNPDNAAVCVTSGLLQHLDRDEVEGVLAHELAHIKNRDTLIQAVAGTLAGAISIIAQMLWFSTLTRENRNPALLLGGMLLAPFAATLIRMAISRSREFTADATAANYTQPGYLANALRKIEAAASRAPMRDGPRGTAHMFIINPFRGDALAKLFSTHPPTEDRITRLETLS